MGYKKSATKKNQAKKATRKPIIREGTGRPHTGFRTDPASIRLAEHFPSRTGICRHFSLADGVMMGLVEEEAVRKKAKKAAKNK